MTDISTHTEDTRTMPLALIMGQVDGQDGLWTAIEAVTSVDVRRYGTLIVFSKQIKGRIGIFCNRYIAGAVVDSAENATTGLDALYQLMQAQVGIFAYRNSFPHESEELSQSLAVDINELMAFHSSERDYPPAEALQSLLSMGDYTLTSGEFLSLDSHTELVELGGSGFAPMQSVALLPTSSQTEWCSDEDFSYLNWSVGGESTDNALSKVLVRALPSSGQLDDLSDEGHTESGVNRDLELYDKILTEEKERVFRDIEKSMRKSQQGSIDQTASRKLSLVEEFLHAEQQKVRTWTAAELDSIPAPSHVRSVSTPAIKPQLRDSRAFVKTRVKDGEPSEQVPDKWWKNRRITIPAFATLVALVFFSQLYGLLDMETDLHRADVLAQSRNYDSAITMLDSLAQRFPNNERIYEKRGIAKALAGQYDEAQKDLEKARGLGGSEELTRLSLASIYCRQGEFDKAIEQCNTLIEKQPNCSAAYALRGVCKLQQGSFREAVADADLAIKYAKNDAEKVSVYTERADCLLKMERYDLAVQDLTHAIQMIPSSVLYRERAYAYRVAGKYESAIADYTRALQADPRDYTCYVGRGICEAAVKKQTEALRDFGRALDLNNTCVEAYAQRGDLLMHMGNARLATRDLQEAHNLNPELHDVETQLSAVSGKLKKGARAPQQSILSMDSADGKGGVQLPKDYNALLRFGLKKLSDGESSDATNAFVTAVKERPLDSRARKYLAHALAHEGRSDDARSQFQALARLQNLDSDDVLVYGHLLAASGSVDDATNLMKQYLERAPQDATVRAELARIYTAIHFDRHAQEVLDEGLRVCGGQQERALFARMLAAPESASYVQVSSRRPEPATAHGSSSGGKAGRDAGG